MTRKHLLPAALSVALVAGTSLLGGLFNPGRGATREWYRELREAALQSAGRRLRARDKPAAWLMAPYLAWVAFATVLNAEIVRRNG